METFSRFAIVMFAVSLIAACDLPRSSQQICDCRLLEGRPVGELSRLEHAPSFFNEDKFWEDRSAPIQHADLAGAFRNRTTHWYRDQNGETFACVVFEGSDQMNVGIAFSAGESLSEPMYMRIIGPEHPPPRLFWERC